MSNTSIESIRSRHWELAVDSIGELLVLLDGEFRVVRANRAVERWQLTSVVEAPGMGIHQLLHKGCDNPGCYLRALQGNLAQQEGSKRVATELRDAELGRWIHLSLEPLQEDPGMADLPVPLRPAFLLTVRDVGEAHRQRLRDGRRTRFESLHFIARVLAHEIGNPLAAMRTTAEVLAENMDRFDQDKVHTYLDRILEGSDRLQSIVERTLRDHQIADLTFEPIALNPLLRRIHRSFEEEMAALGLRFQVLLSSPGDSLVYADCSAVEEVMINVLRNALEATSIGGTILLGSRCEAERILIFVRDTGKGMGRHEQANLFQPFFTTKPHGLGIGLAYSSYLMRKMAGSIGIDSHLGDGTTVTLNLPKVAASTESKSSAAI